MDQQRAYYVDERGHMPQHPNGGRPPNGFSGPYGDSRNDFPMDRLHREQEFDPAFDTRNQYDPNYPTEMHGQPMPQGFPDQGIPPHTRRSMQRRPDDIREALPSRQLGGQDYAPMFDRRSQYDPHYPRERHGQPMPQSFPDPGIPPHARRSMQRRPDDIRENLPSRQLGGPEYDQIFDKRNQNDQDYSREQHGQPMPQGFPDSGIPPHARRSMERRPDMMRGKLPSRQLESQTNRNTLRHRRKMSFHGSIRLPHGASAVEEISRNLNDQELEYEEMDEAVRGINTTLSSKRAIRRRISSRKKKHTSRLKELKYSIAMGWQHFKQSVAEVTYSLELWKSHLKNIEGHFGTSVTSYFLFLKWIFLINIPIFLLTLGFVVIPQVLQRWYTLDADAGTLRVRDLAHAYRATNVSFTGIELLTGTDWFEDTELYYGFYTNFTVELFKGVKYEMKYAYLFTVGGYYLLCFLILAQSILRSYRKYYIEGTSEFSFLFVGKVFCGWDYGITSKESAGLKHKSVYNELMEYLSMKKTKEKKTLQENCHLFWIRVVTNLVVLGMLGGSGYLVYYISITNTLKNDLPVLTSLALPLVITLINSILPMFFSLIEKLERYEKPKTQLYVHLLRTMFLRAGVLGVLVFFWFLKAPQNTPCWETFIGQEIYRLVIVDFIFTLFYTFFFEFVRRLISQYCCAKVGKAEFGVGRNTLDLIYSQALCWLGTFYSPLLSFIVIIKLWLIFYVKRISVTQNCQPYVRTWRAARSHTIFLAFLFAFFLLSTAAVICGVIFVKPSTSCGPYQMKSTTYHVVIELVESLSVEHKWLSIIIGLVSSPGFIAGLVIALSMAAYYMRISMVGHRAMVNLLQQQLILEGKDKNFLMQLLRQAKKKKGLDAVPRSRRFTQNTSASTTLSPGGRAFVKQMVETSARM